MARAPRLHTYEQAMTMAKSIPPDERLPTMRLLMEALCREENPIRGDAELHNNVLLVVCLGMSVLEAITA